MSKAPNYSWEYFVGGVEPHTVFYYHVQSLNDLVNSSEDLTYNEKTIGNNIAELCMMGLAAQFESYCKIQFASLINIYPRLLDQFCERRENAAVSIIDVYKIVDQLNYSVGSLLADNFDFGNSKSINSLFNDLITVSPFSKSESKKYSDFLNKRNLLVHHGGIYTFKYIRQNGKEHTIEDLHNVIVIDKKTYNRWLNFIAKMVYKINTMCHSQLLARIKKDKYRPTKKQKEAIDQYMVLADDNFRNLTSGSS